MSDLPSLKLDFADFWPGFDRENNFFIELLNRDFEVELSRHPDVLIYANFGRRHLAYDCIRVYYTGENLRPPWGECDHAITFDLNPDPRHFRLPLYALYVSPDKLVKTDVNLERLISEKTRFCNFVYSNPGCEERINFFKRLSKYKSVDSGGRLLNNIGGTFVSNKLSFIKDYKFTIAFENSSWPGYTTEKLTDPMLVNSLPLYWGNEQVHLDFNPRSFVSFYEFNNYEAMIERIIEIDNDEALYAQYLSQPWYHDNVPNTYVNSANLRDFFRRVISAEAPPLTKRLLRTISSVAYKAAMATEKGVSRASRGFASRS